MLNPLYIDNIDVYSAYGVYVMEDGLKGLVGMPSFKKVTSTDWHELSGVDADLRDLVLGGRQLSISFHSSHRIPSATAQRFVDFLSGQVYPNERVGDGQLFHHEFLCRETGGGGDAEEVGAGGEGTDIELEVEC